MLSTAAESGDEEGGSRSYGVFSMTFSGGFLARSSFSLLRVRGMTFPSAGLVTSMAMSVPAAPRRRVTQSSRAMPAVRMPSARETIMPAVILAFSAGESGRTQLTTGPGGLPWGARAAPIPTMKGSAPAGPNGKGDGGRDQERFLGIIR